MDHIPTPIKSLKINDLARLNKPRAMEGMLYESAVYSRKSKRSKRL